MSRKKIDQLHNWDACLQDRAQPNVYVAGHLFMSKPQLLGIIYRQYGHF